MSATLDVLIGLILIFLVFSIVVSGVQEWWSQYFGHRGRFLRMGMQRLIGDDAVFVRVLQHPLVGSLYRDRAARGKPPAYIDPANFALAFSDVVLRRAAGNASTSPIQSELTFERLRDALVQLRQQQSPAAQAVAPILDRSAGDLKVALEGLEHWFSGGMDRVSGWYKAYAQRRLFAWGLVLAVLCNVDTIAIFHALNDNPELRANLARRGATIVETGRVAGVDLKRDVGVDVDKGPDAGDASANAAADAKKVVDAVVATPIAGLPIGYACVSAVALTAPAPDGKEPPALAALRDAAGRCGDEWKREWSVANVPRLLLHLLGCVLTALAAVLGAPYWFGLLTKVVNIRGAGPKPDQRKASG